MIGRWPLHSLEHRGHQRSRPIRLKSESLSRYAGLKAKLSLGEQPAENDGIAGHVSRSRTTIPPGNSSNQHFTLRGDPLSNGEDIPRPQRISPAVTASSLRSSFGQLLKAADTLVSAHVAVQCRAIDDRLREEDCRANVIHVARRVRCWRMRWPISGVEQWKRWLLRSARTIRQAFMPTRCDARHALRAKIVQERTFEEPAAPAAPQRRHLDPAQMPVFTQQAPAYDVLVAAGRKAKWFASYLPYRTWERGRSRARRPGADQAGRGADQWGAIQMQNRFMN